MTCLVAARTIIPTLHSNRFERYTYFTDTIRGHTTAEKLTDAHINMPYTYVTVKVLNRFVYKITNTYR